MEIRQKVLIKGERKQTLVNALIDTGASVSMLSESVAREIGAWLTNRSIHVTGVHGDTREMDVLLADISFPNISNVGGRFTFAMGQSTIVGMDILKPLGVVIDTSTGKLRVKNDTWEAFKTLAATGAIVLGISMALGAISEGPHKRSPRRRRAR